MQDLSQKTYSAEDIYAAYTNFYQKAFADYQKEFQKVTRIGGEYFSSAAHGLQANVPNAVRAQRNAA